MIRSFRSFQTRVPETRVEIGNITWPREELLQLADLVNRLDVRDIERFVEQRSALTFELKKLAARKPV